MLLVVSFLMYLQCHKLFRFDGECLPCLHSKFSLFLLVSDCSSGTCELFGICAWVGQSIVWAVLSLVRCVQFHILFAKLMCVLDYR